MQNIPFVCGQQKHKFMLLWRSFASALKSFVLFLFFLFFSLLEFSVFISLVCNEIYFVFYMWRLNVDCWSFRSKKRRWWSTRRTCWQVTTRSPALVGACHRTLHAATPVMQPWASRDSASSSSSHLSWRVTFSLLSSSASLTRLR